MLSFAVDQATAFLTQSQLIQWACLIAIGSVAEWLRPAEAAPSWTSRWENIRYGLFYALVIFVVGPGLFVGIAALVRQIGGGWVDVSAVFGTGLGWQVGAAIVTYALTDFFYYWLHRAQHAIPALWTLHAFHHSDPHMNVSTGVRQHWSEFVLQAVAIALPLGVLFVLPPVTMWTIGAVFSAWSFFIHSNVRLELGRWSWLACGPQVHRLHHSCLPEHTDRNFAAYFPVWDVLFGTYTAPRPGEHPPTGLHNGETIDGPVRMIFYPLPITKWAMPRPQMRFRRLLRSRQP